MTTQLFSYNSRTFDHNMPIAVRFSESPLLYHLAGIGWGANGTKLHKCATNSPHLATYLATKRHFEPFLLIE